MSYSGPYDDFAAKLGGMFGGSPEPIGPDPTMAAFQSNLLGPPPAPAPTPAPDLGASLRPPAPLDEGEVLREAMARGIPIDQVDAYMKANPGQFTGGAPAPAPDIATPMAAPPQTRPAPTVKPTSGHLPAATSGGGGGGEIARLTRAVKGDQGDVEGAIRSEADATRMLGDLQAAGKLAVADQQHQAVLQQQAALAHQAEIDADANQRLAAWRDQSMKMADDLRSQKLDPNRFMRNASTGDQMSFILGGVLGGIMQANQGGENQFMRTLNGLIDRDIMAQQEDYSRGKDQLAARNTIYGQMVQATGDARLAAMQVRQGQLEAAKMDLEATASQYAAPEIRQRAEVAASAIDKELAATHMAFDQHGLQVAQQQANAVAAARAAQQRAAVEALEKAAKLELERRRVAVDEKKADNEAGKKQNEDLERRVEGYGKLIGEKERTNTAQAIADLKRALPADQSEGLPGLGLGAEAKRNIIPGLALVAPKMADRIAFSDEEKINRQNWNRLKDSYRVAVTGAGAGPEELKRLEASFEGASTPAEQRNAVRQVEELLSRSERNARGTYGVDAEAEFRRRVMPSTIEFKGK